MGWGSKLCCLWCTVGKPFPNSTPPLYPQCWEWSPSFKTQWVEPATCTVPDLLGHLLLTWPSTGLQEATEFQDDI